MNRTVVGVAALAGVLLVTRPLAAAPAGPGAAIRFDFETGDLQGWRVTEGAFGKFVCDRAVFHNTGQPYNKQGRYFLSTLEQTDARPSDGFTGIAQSPVFVLMGPQVSFLVGGGSHRATYVALCTADGSEVARARGKDTETMQRIEWTLPELVGKQVFVRIVDGHRGGWGHVTFDDFTAVGVPDEAATRASFARATTVLEDLRLAGLPSPGTPATLRAAIGDLADTFGDRYPRSGEYLARLQALESRLTGGDAAVRKAAGADFAALQREALIANPLVSGQPIVFISRAQYRPDHHNTETLFLPHEINIGSFRGRCALKLIDLAPGGQARTLVDAPLGVVRDPDVHFSGTRIVFSMRRDVRDDYHLYEVGSDGSGLRQLTRVRGSSDIDPLYLPDGGIAFSSTREPKYCMCNRHIMANLFRMEPDGANIHQIGKSTLFEGHGSLTPDGRILYDRWEYVDRNFGDAQGLWTSNPDGTGHAIYWGNNTSSPGAVLDARVIPGTQQTVCSFCACHDRPWGAIAIIDRRLAIDGRAAVVRTWPAAVIESVDRGGYDSTVPLFPKYEDPYPLADPATGKGAGRYFLCSRQTGHEETMAICLLDVFGNEIILYGEEPGCYDPMPLLARPRPPLIAARRDYAGGEGSLYVVDVYRGTHLRGVRRGTVKYLRVVESPEKRHWTYPGWNGQGSESPAMNWHDFNNKRILGTVPVEADGSAHFALPADRFVYFQLLDQDGMMVQSMRSGTIVQSGERTGCVGCHDNRLQAPSLSGRASPRATRRPPDRLTGWYGAPRMFSYMQEVQPVFDRSCVPCHDFGKPAGRTLVLAGDRDLVFNASYNELWRKRFIKVVGAGPAEIQQPYSWGSHASRLVAVLRAGHQGVKLDPASLDRIVTWVDINAPYYPSYASAYLGSLAGRSPLDNARLTRLTELTNVPFLSLADHSKDRGPQVCFERPALSPCLAQFADKQDPRYAEAVAIIAAGKDMLSRLPRADMAGFQACPLDLNREAKYLARAEVEQRVRQAIAEGRKVYDE